MAKKTSKKSPKKLTPKAAKKTAKQPAAARGKKALSQKLDQLRKKFLPAKAVAKPARKRADATVDAAGAAMKSAREVVEAAMPGVRVLGAPSMAGSDAPLHPTSQGAGLDSLRKKYGGPSPAAGRTAAPSAANNSEVVMVESKTPGSDDRGPGPKAIIVSNGRIIGRQG